MDLSVCVVIQVFYCFFAEATDKLKEDMFKTCQAAWADGTWDNLVMQQEMFLIFCDLFRLVPLPATHTTLCMFAQFLSRDFNCPDTVRSYLNGVKWLHVFHSLDTKQFEHFMLGAFHKGMARIKQHKPKQALPITPDLLLEMGQFVDWEKQDDIAFWTLFLLGFYLMARKSNLVPDTVKKFNPKKQLVRSDIQVDEDVLLVTLAWSKTNQFGLREHIVPLVAIHGSLLCPVKAVSSLLAMTPGSGNDPLFQVKCKGRWLPITYPKLQLRLKSWIQLTGRSSDGYSSHSLRRGGASYASRAGVSKEMIKLIGDWKSECVNEYIHFPLEARVEASQRIRSSLLNTEF